MRLILSLVIVSLLAVTCTKQSTEDVSPIVKVNDNVLTKADLEASIPKGLTSEDSIIAAEHYIYTWINDHLKYAVASKNIADKKNIEQLIENYRKSLIIYQYEEQLISERLSNKIDNQSMLDYYEANKDKFKIDRPLIKGLSLRVPIDASQIDKIKVWYKSLTPTNIANIENFCVRNAVGYGYFVDNWVDFNELIENWPTKYKDESIIIKSGKYLEQKDDNYYYFLHITEYLLPEDNAPFEYAQSMIKEILINQQKIDFLKAIEDDLYNKALNNGQVIFYNGE